MGDVERSKDRELLHTIVESVPLRVFWKDRELCYLGCNRLFARDAGLESPEQLIGKSDFDMAWRNEADAYRSDDLRVMESGEAILGFEEPQTTPDGDTIWLRTSKVPLRGPENRVIGILGIYEDITELKIVQAMQQRLNRAMKLLSACNSTLIHATDEASLLADICRLAVEEGGYRMAWVGFAEHNRDKKVIPIAQYGFEHGYLENVGITWDDSKNGRGPTGTCIRTGTTQVNQNFLTNPKMAPWREQALKREFRSSIAMPLKRGEESFGSLTIYAYEPDAFAEDEVKLLEELADDLAYGITTLRTHAELDQTQSRLVDSLENFIQAIAATLESRDPYTAGHQKRVAELSVAIAQTMGLPEFQIQGLHLAATIHDLGKIHIPAEILSKPGRLSAIEYNMVKTHAQVGYDIVKGIEFPWPIANTVFQHHERMDGSGYPQGLKGRDILIEARILAVADVVESMVSHRPYREALGMEAAIAEIRKNHGILYDTEVVDACLEVLSSGTFLDKLSG